MSTEPKSDQGGVAHFVFSDGTCVAATHLQQRKSHDLQFTPEGCMAIVKVNEMPCVISASGLRQRDRSSYRGYSIWSNNESGRIYRCVSGSAELIGNVPIRGQAIAAVPTPDNNGGESVSIFGYEGKKPVIFNIVVP